MRPVDIVRKIAPRARPAYIAAFERGDDLFRRHGITTPRRMAEFLAQIMVESDTLMLERERSNYSAKRILEVFGAGQHSAKVTAAEARRLAGDGPALFERVYGLGNPSKAEELGNTKPGDGWKYRGNGLMQTTGRFNHRVTGEKIGVDFESYPELVTSAAHALEPALYEWSLHNLNQYADKGDTLSISRAINLGNPKSRKTPNGAREREAYAKKILPQISSVDLRPITPDAVPVEKPKPPSSTKHVAAGGVVGAAVIAGTQGTSITQIVAIVAFAVAVVAGIYFFTRKG